MLKKILIVVLISMPLQAMDRTNIDLGLQEGSESVERRSSGGDSSKESSINPNFSLPALQLCTPINYDFCKLVIGRLGTGLAKTINERETWLFPLAALVFDFLKRGQLDYNLAKGASAIRSFTVFGAGISIIKNGIPKKKYPTNSVIRLILEEPYMIYICAQFFNAFKSCNNQELLTSCANQELLTKNLLFLGTVGTGAYLIKSWADIFMKDKDKKYSHS